MPLGRLVPLGRFGASWNIPLTVGDILYTPAGRIMRDERLLVTLLVEVNQDFIERLHLLTIVVSGKMGYI